MLQRVSINRRRKHARRLFGSAGYRWSEGDREQRPAHNRTRTEIIAIEPEDMIGTTLFEHGHFPIDTVELVDWALYRRGELSCDQLEKYVNECVDIREARVLGARAARGTFVTQFAERLQVPIEYIANRFCSDSL